MLDLCKSLINHIACTTVLCLTTSDKKHKEKTPNIVQYDL